MPSFVFEGGGKSAKKEREERPYLSEKPVQAGGEYDVTVEEVGTRGDGFVRIQNYIVFIAGSSKGERMRIKVTKVLPKFAIAERIGEAKTPAPAKPEEPASSETPDE